MKTAIYCRVSTENQEREGTSLGSQKEACLKKAKEQSYDILPENVFIETYSGLDIERPELNKLRELIRNKEVSAVIAYALDRVSRDPVHFILIQDEMERAGCTLILCTETVDSSDMGKLISHIRGFAAKLETEKIRERTMRGKKVKLAQGQIPHGCGKGIYGYDWNKQNKKRLVNESEAPIVRRIFSQVAVGDSRLKIAIQLNKESIPAKGGGLWYPLTIRRVAINESYTGVTYENTMGRVKVDGKRKLFMRPKNEWINLPNATPPIISKELFDKAQAALAKSKELRNGHPHYEYLLTGYIKCGDCGGPMVGGCLQRRYRYYRCRNTAYTATKPKTCNASYIKAEDIEADVWNVVKDTYKHPDALLAELDKEAKDDDNSGTTIMGKEIARLKRQLGTYDNQKQRLVSLFRIQDKIGENTILDELNKLADDQKQDEEKLSQLIATKERIASLANAKAQFTGYLNLVSGNLEDLSFEERKRALKGLNIQVVANKETYSINGLVNVLTIERTLGCLFNCRYIYTEAKGYSLSSA